MSEMVPRRLSVNVSNRPRLLILKQPGRGFVTMEYYAFNAPFAIDLPDCMKSNAQTVYSGRKAAAGWSLRLKVLRKESDGEILRSRN